MRAVQPIAIGAVEDKLFGVEMAAVRTFLWSARQPPSCLYDFFNGSTQSHRCLNLLQPNRFIA